MGRRDRSTDDPFARIAPYYDQLMANVPYGMWAEYLMQLADLAGRPFQAGSHVLDLATGTGSVAFEFARRGCSVTGLDRSEPMLAQARRRAADLRLSVTFIQSDLSDFRLPPHFDHALCLYDSLNYILDLESLERTFANTRAALHPGGIFIFDVNTVRALEAELFTQRSPEDAPIQYRWASKYNAKTRVSRIRMRFHIPAAGEKFTTIHYQRAYTDDDLRRLLGRAGFDSIATYQAYRLDAPTPTTDRAFYVARAA